MKYYIIAGEPSGDLHGSNLMKAILEEDVSAEFAFWGGDHMLGVSKGLVTHIKDTAIMGFVEVVKNLPKLAYFFKKAKKTIAEFKPDVVVFIDYPGFNLRMTKWAKNQGYKTVYYISPQLWAWKKGRIEIIKKYVDELIVILPFEYDFYRDHGVESHYVGHPLLSVIEDHKSQVKPEYLDGKSKKILAILPGSRKQEIQKMLPEMMSAALRFEQDYILCIAQAPNVDAELFMELLGENYSSFQLIEAETYDLLTKAQLAMVTSGTATLETALFGVPQVVCYKTGRLNYEIGRRLVDLKFISLVNLIAGEEIVPELIQNRVNSEEIYKTLRAVERNSFEMKQRYTKLQEVLFTNERPSKKAAEIVVRVTRA